MHPETTFRSNRHPEPRSRMRTSDAPSASRTALREGPLFAFRLTALALSVFLPTVAVTAKTKSSKSPSTDSLDAYLATARQPAPTDVPTLGSLWDPHGRMSDLATDTKARFVGDLVTINIVESTNSAQQESAQTSRAFSASSSLAALLGTINNPRAQNLFSPSSTQSLNGKGQTALATSLTTTLAASVAEVLPNGNLVIEARRDVLVTNQKETMILRGIIRREDLSPANVVASTAISHLEVSLKGNGVISESTRAPNVIVRILLRVLNF
jgi:flagellar L-ring protein FlgH